MNLDKLDAAIEWIEAHPEQHDQGDPFARRECGTTACLAGILCLLDGWEPAWEDDEEEDAYFAVKNGEKRNAMRLARELLGATRYQADSLFLESWSLDEIKARRDEYATSGEAGERSDHPNPSDLGGSS